MTAIAYDEQPPRPPIGTVGFLNAYGVFQAYYQTHLLPDRSASDIAWIGSVSIFLLYLGAGFAGPLMDKFGPASLLWAGSIVLLAAIFATSLGEKYWQLFLTQDILLGAGMSLVFCTPLGVVMRHMPHRRGLAMGLTIGGASISGVVWPVMLQQLLVEHNVSFAWTMRVVGFTLIPLLTFVCLTVVEPPPPPSLCSPTQANQTPAPTPNLDGPEEKIMIAHVDVKQVNKMDFSVLKKRTYILLCVGLAIDFLALNAASFFGSVPGHLADKYGHYNLLVTLTLLSGDIGFCWTAATALAGLVVWSMACMPLKSKVTIEPSDGDMPLTAWSSTSALIGAPIGGQILSHSGFLTLSIWTGATLVAGAAIVGAARLSENQSYKVVF
ncbi:hypothetical protein DL765_005578 [Monosporascus sp. GIB2]|nr:hypothetical protein DL765_005578 [Monosporascus sp. GIB2]